VLTAPRPTRRLRAIRTALVIHPSGQEEDRHELRQDAHPHVEGSCHSSVLRSGGRRTALYEMSKPPDPLTATEEELRADLSQVLSALERVSLVSEMEDHLRRVYFRRVRIMALVALAIMIGTTARAATYQCAATRADRYTGRGPATRLTRTAFLHSSSLPGPTTAWRWRSYWPGASSRDSRSD